MANEIRKYILNAELSTMVNGKAEKERFQFMLHIVHLEDVGQDASFYDPELKMHFADITALGSIYQINIQDIYLKLSSRLDKAADFIRRASYVNDWMEIRANTRGIVKSVENRDELKENWKVLRSMLSHDYTGEAVEQNLIEIDERWNISDKILPAVYTYLNFGLIFPHIPPKHDENWENRRKVTLSEYENGTFEEHLCYVGEQEGSRQYSVVLSSAPEQQTEIEQASGYILVNHGEILPQDADIEVNYRSETVQKSWQFKLKKY